MPLFASAQVKICDPVVGPSEDEIHFSPENPETVEEGVEMRIQLGVYDVHGVCDEKKLAQQHNIPIVTLPEPEPLIQELNH